MSFPGSQLLSDEMVLKTYAARVNPLGTRGYTRDGRVFRFARNGATALVPGKLCQSAAAMTGQTGCISGTTEIRANSSVIKIVPSTKGLFNTANGLQDGYLWAYTSSTAKGTGQMIQIKGHTKSTSTGTAVTIYPYIGGEFYSATTNFGTTSVDIGVLRNPYDKVVVVPTAGAYTAPAIGVPVRPIAANYYFWIQTWGACPVRSQGVVDVGDPVGMTTGSSVGCVDGCTSTKATSAANSFTFSGLRALMGNIGVAMNTGVAGEYMLVFLKIAP